MTSKFITILGLMQTFVLVVGWIISSIAVRHGPTWETTGLTLGKWYRLYGAAFLVVPLLWVFLAMFCTSRFVTGWRIWVAAISGILILIGFIWVSCAAFASGTRMGFILYMGN
jgi:hypothetical protein